MVSFSVLLLQDSKLFSYNRHFKGFTFSGEAIDEAIDEGKNLPEDHSNFRGSAHPLIKYGRFYVRRDLIIDRIR
jgi:hypothetical protein